MFSLTGIILRFWNHRSVKNKCFLQMRCLQPDSGKHTLTQYVQHAIKQLSGGFHDKTSNVIWFLLWNNKFQIFCNENERNSCTNQYNETEI